MFPDHRYGESVFGAQRDQHPNFKGAHGVAASNQAPNELDEQVRPRPGHRFCEQIEALAGISPLDATVERHLREGLGSFLVASGSERRFLDRA
jgi:hypothetical protein